MGGVRGAVGDQVDGVLCPLRVPRLRLLLNLRVQSTPSTLSGEGRGVPDAQRFLTKTRLVWVAFGIVCGMKWRAGWRRVSRNAMRELMLSLMERQSVLRYA